MSSCTSVCKDCIVSVDETSGSGHIEVLCFLRLRRRGSSVSSIEFSVLTISESLSSLPFVFHSSRPLHLLSCLKITKSSCTNVFIIYYYKFHKINKNCYTVKYNSKNLFRYINFIRTRRYY